MYPRVAALRHGAFPQETFVSVIVNAPKRRVTPRLGREENGAVSLRMPPEMELKLERVFRQGATDARAAQC